MKETKKCIYDLSRDVAYLYVEDAAKALKTSVPNVWKIMGSLQPNTVGSYANVHGHKIMVVSYVMVLGFGFWIFLDGKLKDHDWIYDDSEGRWYVDAEDAARVLNCKGSQITRAVKTQKPYKNHRFCYKKRSKGD